MSGVNKVILLGRLGKDPEVKFLDNGGSVCSMSLATRETWTDKGGQKQERTEWHRVVAFGKTAELCGEYLAKGREVFLEGRLQTRKWTDKTGAERYTTEVVADRVQFIGGGKQQQAAAEPAYDEAPF